MAKSCIDVSRTPGRFDPTGPITEAARHAEQVYREASDARRHLHVLIAWATCDLYPTLTDEQQRRFHRRQARVVRALWPWSRRQAEGQVVRAVGVLRRYAAQLKRREVK